MAKRQAKYSGPLRALRVLRCSTDDQGEGDYTTLDVQDADTKRYVQEKGYIDCGSMRSTATGTTLKRPDWKKAYAMAQAGEIDVVVTTFRSRLGRGVTADLADYLLEECGVRVEHVHKTYSADNKGRTAKRVDSFLDGMYVDAVRENTTVKMNAMFRDGLVVGHLSFGYAKQFTTASGTWDGEGKRPPQRAIVDSVKGPLVLHAFERLRDTCEIARVRDYLNTVTDEKWDTTKTKSLLRDESYCGVYTFGQRRKEGGLPVIVEPSLFEEVQEILDGIEGRYSADRLSACDDYTYYLHQRVYCPFCEGDYTNAAAKGGAVLRVLLRQQESQGLPDQAHELQRPARRGPAGSSSGGGPPHGYAQDHCGVGRLGQGGREPARRAQRSEPQAAVPGDADRQLHQEDR